MYYISLCILYYAAPLFHTQIVYCNKNEHVCDMAVYGIQVYNTLFSLQQIVVIYKLQVYNKLMLSKH